MTATATRQRFQEYAASHGRVDREGGWLRSVKLLGAESKNGRRYTDAAMADAAPLYNGKKVYLNHPRKSEMDDDRSIHDCVGVIENARFTNGGIFGDVRLRKQSPHYEEIMELAENFSSNFGFSHVADGSSRWDGHTEVIEQITSVFSVDLVTDAATTAGLFESIDGDNDSATITVPCMKARMAVQKLRDQFGARLGKDWLAMLDGLDATLDLVADRQGDGILPLPESKAEADSLEESTRWAFPSSTATPNDYFPSPPTRETLRQFANRLR